MSMTMKYRFGREGRLEDIIFDGLDGRENVTSTKEALQLMKIRNPAIDFSEAAQKGHYNDVPEKNFQQMVEAIGCIQELWRYPDDPADCKCRYEMSPLTLLGNAIRLVAQQNAELRKYRQKG